MTEKRFIIDSIGVFHDNHNALHDLEVVDLLNALHEENEQLKHDIKFLKSDKNKLDKYHSRLVYHMNKFAGEKNYAETLSNLSEENEQLKATIKEAYENERTALGRSVLKQLIDKME